jgi:AraC family transcriptional regulator of adaptative response/methylated-DNA-[protein]-cysteine methyltransferase
MTRLPDWRITLQAVSRQKAASLSRDLTIYYGYHDTPVGTVLIAVQDNDHICFLGFTESEPPVTLKEIQNAWPSAKLVASDKKTKTLIDKLFNKFGAAFPVRVCGTPFQLAVWRALTRVRPGKTRNYQAIARLIGKPRAQRAVGSAIGRNPVSLLIPCHRIIRSDGATGSYRGGAERKRALLALEI